MIIAKNFNIDEVKAKPYLKISLTLKKVGIRRHYKGYPRMAYAIYLVMEDESRLEAMMKEVYMPVAEKYNCSWESVERSMLSLRDMIWKNHREQLCAMTGFELTEPPQESYLLEIFAIYQAREFGSSPSRVRRRIKWSFPHNLQLPLPR